MLGAREQDLPNSLQLDTPTRHTCAGCEGGGTVTVEDGECWRVCDLEDDDILSMSADRTSVIEIEMAHHWAREGVCAPKRADLVHIAAHVLKVRGSRCCNAMYSRVLRGILSLPKMCEDQLGSSAALFEAYNVRENRKATMAFLQLVEDGLLTHTEEAC
jgi:hypothetical protein